MGGPIYYIYTTKLRFSLFTKLIFKKLYGINIHPLRFKFFSKLISLNRIRSPLLTISRLISLLGYWNVLLHLIFNIHQNRISPVSYLISIETFIFFLSNTLLLKSPIPRLPFYAHFIKRIGFEPMEICSNLQSYNLTPLTTQPSFL